MTNVVRVTSATLPEPTVHETVDLSQYFYDQMVRHMENKPDTLAATRDALQDVLSNFGVMIDPRDVNRQRMWLSSFQAYGGIPTDGVPPKMENIMKEVLEFAYTIPGVVANTLAFQGYYCGAYYVYNNTGRRSAVTDDTLCSKVYEKFGDRLTSTKKEITNWADYYCEFGCQQTDAAIKVRDARLTEYIELLRPEATASKSKKMPSPDALRDAAAAGRAAAQMVAPSGWASVADRFANDVPDFIRPAGPPPPPPPQDRRPVVAYRNFDPVGQIASGTRGDLRLDDVNQGTAVLGSIITSSGSGVTYRIERDVVRDRFVAIQVGPSVDF